MNLTDFTKESVRTYGVSLYGGWDFCNHIAVYLLLNLLMNGGKLIAETMVGFLPMAISFTEKDIFVYITIFHRNTTQFTLAAMFFLEIEGNIAPPWVRMTFSSVE